MTEVGIADHPNKIKQTAKISEKGRYVFPRLADEKIYNISIEPKNFCWANLHHKIKVEKMTSMEVPSFQHTGYRVNYKTPFKFEA